MAVGNRRFGRTLMFRNRLDAARKLARVLPEVDTANTIVLALPRGGVPIGEVVARVLGVPLDVLIVRKLRAPGQPELAVGAVSDGGKLQIAVNEDIAESLGLSDQEIGQMAERERGELERRGVLYRSGRSPLTVSGKCIVLVDDGIATGATVRSALKLLKLSGVARITLAVPVAPPATIQSLAAIADEIVCLSAPEPFYAVGAHYFEFNQVSDSEVIETLARHQVPPAGDEKHK